MKSRDGHFPLVVIFLITIFKLHAYPYIDIGDLSFRSINTEMRSWVLGHSFRGSQLS